MKRATLSEWAKVLGARVRCKDAWVNGVEDIVLLDTALGSENSGDEIIMDACDSVCRGLWNGAEPREFRPTIMCLRARI